MKGEILKVSKSPFLSDHAIYCRCKLVEIYGKVDKRTHQHAFVLDKASPRTHRTRLLSIDLVRVIYLYSKQLVYSRPILWVEPDVIRNMILN